MGFKLASTASLGLCSSLLHALLTAFTSQRDLLNPGIFGQRFACWVLQACLRIFRALSFHKRKSRHKENRTELKLLTISWGVFQLIWWVLSSQMICTSLGLIIARFCFHYKHLTFQSREGCSSNSVKLVLEMNLFKHRWGQVPPFHPFLCFIFTPPPSSNHSVPPKFQHFSPALQSS